MLDLKFIREHPDVVKRGMKSKGVTDRVDELLKLDERRRSLIQKSEGLKAKKNAVSAEIARMKESGKDVVKSVSDMNAVKEEIKALDEQLSTVEQEVGRILLSIPNIPHPSVPVGTQPADNQEILRWGESVEVDFTLKPHWELGEKLEVIDFARGGKVTGSAFPFLVGKGARLERALINFFLDQAIAQGYREIMPPLLVNEASASGTGQLPDKEDLMYVLEREQLYLVPTAEVPVSNFHRDETLREEDLPVCYAAYTPCFRREAGSYGKDVRGLNRVHQFDKVELVK
ncbi:MAG TPA: serine--tRNA ligase, partial [Rhodothermia bacterium]|nr:serine--tRNA ligase [Rhodothermia bacterium]